MSSAYRMNFQLDKAREVVQQTTNLVLKGYANFVADRARHYCPVDTGHLKSTITVITSNDGMYSSVYVGANYAAFVEYGHWDGIINGMWVPPNPFFRMALAEAKAEFPHIAQTTWKNAGVYRQSGPNVLGAEFTQTD